MKALEVRNRLQQMIEYTDRLIGEKGNIEIESDSLEEDILCSGLRDIAFDIEYR